MSIYGNMIGGASPIKTITLVSESGREVIGVVTENRVLFTALDGDVREGKVYAGDHGVSVGTLKVDNTSPYVLSCTFTGILNTEFGVNKYTLQVNGLTSSIRHFVVVSCRQTQDSPYYDIIMWRRNDLSSDFTLSIIDSSFKASNMSSVGENNIEIMMSESAQDFIVTVY